jgi:hypothetical protein
MSGRNSEIPKKRARVRDPCQLSKFIKTAAENPVLWTGMKRGLLKAEKNKSDAETSSA